MSACRCARHCGYDPVQLPGQPKPVLLLEHSLFLNECHARPIETLEPLSIHHKSSDTIVSALLSSQPELQAQRIDAVEVVALKVLVPHKAQLRVQLDGRRVCDLGFKHNLHEYSV
jgi:hypothetical protein